MTSEPKILNERIEAEGAEIDLEIPRDLFFWPSHFPGAPVLPGVIQVAWALALAEKALGLTGDVRGIENLKFRQVIKPGAQVRLTLTHVARTGKLHFAYASEEGAHSSGRILIG